MSDPDLLTASDYLERQAGCDFHRAVIHADLESAAYTAYDEYRHAPETAPSPEWLAAVKLIAETDPAIFERPRP